MSRSMSAASSHLPGCLRQFVCMVLLDCTPLMIVKRKLREKTPSVGFAHFGFAHFDAFRRVER